MALARASIALGDRDAASQALLRAWLNPDMDDTVEAAAVQEFGSMLSEADYRRRLWMLIYAQESGAAVNHASRMGSSQPTSPRSPRPCCAARQVPRSVWRLSASTAMIGAALCAGALLPPHEKFSKARSILAAAPSTAADMGDPGAWWTERRIIARRSVGPNHATAGSRPIRSLPERPLQG